MLSFPHRLPLTGRFFISVVGSSHKTVCFPQAGQRKRLYVANLPSSCVLWCAFSDKCYHPNFWTQCDRRTNLKACTTQPHTRLDGTGAKAQAQFQLLNHFVASCFWLTHKWLCTIIHIIAVYVKSPEPKKSRDRTFIFCSLLQINSVWKKSITYIYG